MDKKTQIIAALESHYKARLDRFSLDINFFLNEEPNLNALIASIGLYARAMSEFNFVQRLKEQALESQNEG